MLPLPVLEKAANEMTDFQYSGMSVMEMSHRSPRFEKIIREAESDLRKLMKIPANYKVLFLQGGATTQFSAVPMNLLNGSKKADYVVTGLFSQKAMQEAKKYGDVRMIASSFYPDFSNIPRLAPDDFRSDADYVHICLNNTVYGTKWDYIPDTGEIPLVADLSSCILSEPIDVSKFGLIYAGAQKNMGIAGLTVVIVREELLGNCRSDTPVMLDYKRMADHNSLYNTPPCYAVYVAGLVLEWLLQMGGLEVIERHNREKAALLYNYLDDQNYYRAPAERNVRSMMNVVFTTDDPNLDKLFVVEAEQSGLCSLKGHRAAGGLRASIYNAMPEEGVARLVEFMDDFAKTHLKA